MELPAPTQRASGSRAAGAIRASGSLRPTMLGIKGAVFLALLLLAFFASAYQNLFFLLLAFLGVLSSLTAWWCVRNAHRVDAALLPVTPIPAGAAPLVQMVLTPARGIAHQVTARIAVGRRLRAIGHVQELREEVVVHGYVDPLPRGLHVIAGHVVESLHPFGLFRAQRSWALPSEIVVHPRPARIDGLRDLRSAVAMFGGQARSRAGEPVIGGLREWREGEDLRSVHWKASARRGDLVVREWDRTAPERLVVCVDRRTDEEPLEFALSIVMALSELCRAAHDTLTLHSQGHVASYGQDQRPWDELLRWLAGAQVLPASAAPLPPVEGALRLPPARESLR